MYVEICKSVKDRNNFIPLAEVGNQPTDHELYISLFPFDQTILSYLKAHNSIKGHQGKHYCPYILIDIDSENDVKAGQVETVKLIRRLNQMYQIDVDELYIYFSGGKGFHVVIPGQLYSPLSPCADIGEKIKNAVKILAEGIEFVDYKIYENHRIIRVDNSRHKSGYYKIQLSFEELSEWTIDEIKKMAKSPRNFTRMIYNSEMLVNQTLDNALKRSYAPQISDDNAKKVYDIQSNFFTPPLPGNRNTQLHKQACALFMYSELSEANIFNLVQVINQSSEKPLPEPEVKNIVSSASSARTTQVDQDVLKTSGLIGDFMEEHLKSFEEERDKISLVFESLNKEFDGALRSKVGVVLGYGGSKKSMYAQSVAYFNMLKGRRILYSNMEMGQNELINRFYDISFQGTKKLPSTELKYQMKHDLQKAKDSYVKEFVKKWGDKLIVTNGTSMTCEHYDYLLMDAREKYGKIDMLIVDGLSMMGGKGDEMERANRHSQELKELAKDHNIFVLVIVHASRGEDLTRRDLSKKARGSEKILDNCDFVMTNSLIKVKNDEYSQAFGVYHLWNKRGSGNRIEKVFEFYPMSLRLKESSIDVRELEKKVGAGFDKKDPLQN